MLEGGVTGGKDILAHVTTWEQEALKHLPLLLRGEKPPRYSVTHGGIHAFDARMTEQKAGLPLADVLQDLETTHNHLGSFLESAPEDQLRGETRFRRRLRLDTYSHYFGAFEKKPTPALPARRSAVQIGASRYPLSMWSQYVLGTVHQSFS